MGVLGGNLPNYSHESCKFLSWYAGLYFVKGSYLFFPWKGGDVNVVSQKNVLLGKYVKSSSTEKLEFRGQKAI